MSYAYLFTKTQLQVQQQRIIEQQVLGGVHLKVKTQSEYLFHANFNRRSPSSIQLSL